MAITSDWHIHTHCSCDSACMDFEALVKSAKECGITDFGVSDHYHTRLQEQDIANGHKEFEKTIEAHPELRGHFHFGIEATIISEWEIEKILAGDYVGIKEAPTYGVRIGGPKNAPVTLDFGDEFIEKYGIEYVVSGVHWPMYCDTDRDSLLKEYHRQYMFAATHPYTTILAHYMWYDSGLFKNLWEIKDAKNPFIDFSTVPVSMLDELKAALLEYNTAFELNLGGIVLAPSLPDSFKDEYLGWAADLQKSGVVLAAGSDSHAAALCSSDYEQSNKMFEHYGIDTSKFFCL